MSSKFRPMKGAALLENIPVEKQLESLRYPKFLTPKYDGFRILMHQQLGVVTSALKPFPNVHVKNTLDKFCNFNLDGEIICGNHECEYDFNKTSSQLRRFDGKPDYTVFVFDTFGIADISFDKRYRYLKSYLWAGKFPEEIRLAPMAIAHKPADVLNFEEKCLANGYEGVMIRCPSSPYKYGKGTLKEEFLLKLKRFVDHDGVIIGFEELMHNDNEQTINEKGLSKRSSHQENMRPAGTLGKLKVRGLEGDFKDQEFSIGTGIGLTQAWRQEIWDNQGAYLGRRVVFKYQDHGIKDKPRLPVLKGVRED